MCFLVRQICLIQSAAYVITMTTFVLVICGSHGHGISIPALRSTSLSNVARAFLLPDASDVPVAPRLLTGDPSTQISRGKRPDYGLKGKGAESSFDL
jgi:hypothetical protein